MAATRILNKSVYNLPLSGTGAQLNIQHSDYHCFFTFGVCRRKSSRSETRGTYRTRELRDALIAALIVICPELLVSKIFWFPNKIDNPVKSCHRIILTRRRQGRCKTANTNLRQIHTRSLQRFSTNTTINKSENNDTDQDLRRIDPLRRRAFFYWNFRVCWINPSRSQVVEEKIEAREKVRAIENE